MPPRSRTGSRRGLTATRQKPRAAADPAGGALGRPGGAPWVWSALLAVAMFATHGLDVEAWPASVREALRL